MTFVFEVIVSICLVIGGIFGLVGSMGLIKLKETMQRLHAPTKATTLGVGGVMIGSMLYFILIEGQFTFHEFLISIFLFLTAPISAHFIAKTYIQAKVKVDELPKTETEYGWAVYDDAPPYYDED